MSEMRRGQIQTVGLTEGCCILAAVGDGMVHAPGVAGKFFTALGFSAGKSRTPILPWLVTKVA